MDLIMANLEITIWFKQNVLSNILLPTSQLRLNAFSIWSIEYKLASSINFDGIIHNIAEKSKKRKF